MFLTFTVMSNMPMHKCHITETCTNKINYTNAITETNEVCQNIRNCS